MKKSIFCDLLFDAKPLDNGTALQVIGRDGETATLFSRCLFNSELRVFGFAPRQLSRSASSLDMEKRVAKVDGLYLQGEPSERFSGTINFELRPDCIYYQWRIKTKEGECFKAIPVSFRIIPKDENSFEFAASAVGVFSIRIGNSV